MGNREILTIRYSRWVPLIESAGPLVREARQRAGMTQGQPAERTGVTQSVISAYESGRRQPSLPVLLGLIACTGHCFEVRWVSADPGKPASFSWPLGRRVSRHRRRINEIAA